MSSVDSFVNFQYMYTLEPVLDRTVLNYIAGTVYENTVFCALAKLATPFFSYNSIVWARMIANPKAILGDNLPCDTLVGTLWDTYSRPVHFG